MIPTVLKLPMLELLQWVPDSSSGLTAPSLHRLTGHVLPLKYSSHQQGQRYFHNDTAHKQSVIASVDFLMQHVHIVDMFDLYFLVKQTQRFHHATIAYIRVVVLIHTSLDLKLPYLIRFLL